MRRLVIHLLFVLWCIAAKAVFDMINKCTEMVEPLGILPVQAYNQQRVDHLQKMLGVNTTLM